VKRDKAATTKKSLERRSYLKDSSKHPELGKDTSYDELMISQLTGLENAE